MTEKLLNTQQVADHLGLHVRTVAAWCLEGRLRHYKLGVGRNAPLRIPESELKRLLQESERGSPSSNKTQTQQKETHE